MNRREVLKTMAVLEKSLFHCADEPDGDAQMADYRKARALLEELAPWMKVMDAMSDPRLATERLSDMPVPSIATVHAFAAADCPAWTYCCCGPRGRVGVLPAEVPHDAEEGPVPLAGDRGAQAVSGAVVRACAGAGRAAQVGLT